MATIVNRRQHALEGNGVHLTPGTNTVDDEQWSKANVKGSQFEEWFKLGWIAQAPSDKQAQGGAPPGKVFSAPSVDGPVSQEPGSDMNPAPRAPATSQAGPSAPGTPSTPPGDLAGERGSRLKR